MDDAELTVGIVAPGCASYTRKQTDELTEFVKRSQIGAKGLVWVKVEPDGSFKSSVNKFFTPKNSHNGPKGWKRSPETSCL